MYTCGVKKEYPRKLFVVKDGKSNRKNRPKPMVLLAFLFFLTHTHLPAVEIGVVVMIGRSPRCFEVRNFFESFKGFRLTSLSCLKDTFRKCFC